MAQSNAHADRENVTAALRQFGMTDGAIEGMFQVEAEIQARQAAKRAANRKPVAQPTLFDF